MQTMHCCHRAAPAHCSENRAHRLHLEALANQLPMASASAHQPNCQKDSADAIPTQWQPAESKSGSAPLGAWYDSYIMCLLHFQQWSSTRAPNMFWTCLVSNVLVLHVASLQILAVMKKLLCQAASTVWFALWSSMDLFAPIFYWGLNSETTYTILYL